MVWRGLVRGEPRGVLPGKFTENLAAVVHTTLHTLTVREVKVIHMPPKPLKVRAIKIRTERSANNTDVISRGFPQSDTLGQKAVIWFPHHLVGGRRTR